MIADCYLTLHNRSPVDAHLGLELCLSARRMLLALPHECTQGWVTHGWGLQAPVSEDELGIGQCRLLDVLHALCLSVPSSHLRAEEACNAKLQCCRAFVPWKRETQASRHTQAEQNSADTNAACHGACFVQRYNHMFGGGGYNLAQQPLA